MRLIMDTAQWRGIGMKTAVVLGTGLIGTSVALALSQHGVVVLLEDRDPDTARTAASLGAGTVLVPEGLEQPVDLAVLAVLPAHVARTLGRMQERDLARAYTDVCSVKAGPAAQAAALGVWIRPRTSADIRWRVGRSRVRSRRAATCSRDAPGYLDALLKTPAATCSIARLELVSLCGAVPVVMDPVEHDRAVALISHAPHLVSVLMAARLEYARPRKGRADRLYQGVRDVTRIAAGDPALWREILTANAGAVADVLSARTMGISEAVIGLLRALAKDPAGASGEAANDELVERLRRGKHRPGADSGQARRPTRRVRDGPGRDRRCPRRVGPAVRGGERGQGQH